MRIALVSTPFLPVPPPLYGGTELIVDELLRGLTARGHHVTLFATGDSRPPAGVRLRARFATAVWPPDPYAELAHAAFAMQEIARDQNFDLVHAHVPAALPFAALAGVPMVCTVHHEREPNLTMLYQGRASGATLVAISERQREICGLGSSAAVVHHGVSPGRYPIGRGERGYAAFLGRFAAEKGPHHAIDAALCARVPLELAGCPHWRDVGYIEDEIAPRLRDAAPGQVTFVGEIGGPRKPRFLGSACALLFPIEWEEPFGLVMIEAMLCGTPVLAFSRGSVPEVIDHGVTGFVCRDADEMAAHLTVLARGGFDRAACRARAHARFSAERMVNDYERLYLALLGCVNVGERAQPRA